MSRENIEAMRQSYEALNVAVVSGEDLRPLYEPDSTLASRVVEIVNGRRVLVNDAVAARPPLPDLGDASF